MLKRGEIVRSGMYAIIVSPPAENLNSIKLTSNELCGEKSYEIQARERWVLTENQVMSMSKYFPDNDRNHRGLKIPNWYLYRHLNFLLLSLPVLLINEFLAFACPDMLQEREREMKSRDSMSLPCVVNNDLSPPLNSSGFLPITLSNGKW